MSGALRRRDRRLAGAAAVASALAIGLLAQGDGSTARSAPGAAAGPALVLTPSTAPPGRRVVVAGRGFRPRRTVTLRVAGRLVRRVRTGRRGRLRTRFRVPARRPGRYFVRARSGRLTARARLRVLAVRRPPSAPPPPPAPPSPSPSPAAQPPPAPPAPPTLVAAGDIACIPGWAETATECRHARTAAVARALAPDVVASLGDAQYQQGELENYLTSYHPTWGTLKAITRPATGNHEYLEDPTRQTAAGHFGYFGAAAGEPDEGYYGYGLGDWRVFVLNTGALEWTRTGGGASLPDDCFPVSCAAGSDQEAWLRDGLEALPDDACVLAYWHHPRYSSGWNDNPQPHPEVAPLWQALQDHGAEVVLTGHAHAYERFTPMDAAGNADSTGLRQFVVGTGGRSLFVDPGPQQPGSERLETSAFGVLELELTPDGYDYRFIREDGAVLDSGTGACHDRPA